MDVRGKVNCTTAVGTPDYISPEILQVGIVQMHLHTYACMYVISVCIYVNELCAKAAMKVCMYNIILQQI